MSLINKMLRDLDERHAPPVDRTGLPPAIHALPAAPDRSGAPFVLVAAIVAVGAAAFYWLQSQEASPPAPAAPMPTVVRPPALPEPAPVVAAPSDTSVAPSAVEQKQDAAFEPKMSAILAAPPKTEAASAAPAPLPAAIADDQAQPQAARPPKSVRTEGPPAQKAPVASKAAGPVSTDKHKAEAVATPSVAPVPVVTRPALAAAREDASSTPASIDKRPRNPLANETAEASYRKAMTAVRRGAVAEAIEGLRATLKLEAHHASARQALLSLLVEQQQWDEARLLLEEGLSTDPTQTSWAMALARLQLEHGRLPEAVDTLSRHVRHAEQNPDYLAFLALLLQKQKRGQEAAERYRAALAIRPMESRWWYGLGLVLDADQKPQEAREAFLKARETGGLSAELAAAVEQKLR